MAFGQAAANLTGASPRSPGVTIAEGPQRIYAKFTDNTLSVVDFGYRPKAEIEAERIAAEQAEAARVAAKPKRVRPSRSKAAIAARAAAQAAAGAGRGLRDIRRQGASGRAPPSS